MRIFIECRQRPLCRCPTVFPFKDRSSLEVSASCATIKDLKLYIQQQLARGGEVNRILLSPERMELKDPKEGHIMQDHMQLRQTGILHNCVIKLSLSGLPATTARGQEWCKSFDRAESLTIPRAVYPNRPIRDVALSTSISRTGGTPDFATSFCPRETERLSQWAELSIMRSRVAEEAEWDSLDRLDRSLVDGRAAGQASCTLVSEANKLRVRGF